MKNIYYLLIILTIGCADDGDNHTVRLDTTAPQITILGDNPQTITQYTEYTELGATALDDTDGDISDAIEISSTVNTNIVGTYEVTYNAVDAAGNSASVIREVNVELETIPPVITLLGDNPQTITQYTEYIELGATALDDTDGDITDAIEISSTVNMIIVGTYEVTYSVSDAAGNSASATRQVIVEVGPNPVYLDSNGITVKAYDWAAVGAVGTISGVPYTIIDRPMLDAMLANNESVIYVCTTKITNMSEVFKMNTTFNQDISSWDVSNVTNMERVFYLARDFNQDIGDWDVGNVTSMEDMFFGQIDDGFDEESVVIFNKDIGNWDVNNVTNMKGMFSGAKDFNQDIGNWDVSNVNNMASMFSCFDTYDGGSSLGNFNQDIGNWDVSNVTNMKKMFYGATEFNQDIGNWDVGNVTNMENMFHNSDHQNGYYVANGEFNQDIGDWDVSNVTNMKRMFNGAYSFNQDIGNWNVSNVTNMGSMFSNAATFNQPIGSWDVRNVTNMGNMFAAVDVFNQPIGNWNVSNVTNMVSMFSGADAFNQDIGNWDVSSVTNMFGMFNATAVFNQDLSSWNVINVTDCSIFSESAESWVLPQPNFTNCTL